MNLFGAPSGLPEGFKHQPDVGSPDDEDAPLQRVRELPFRDFEFQGYVGKGRVVSYGWHYDFNQKVLREADDIPSFLLSLREIAAGLAAIAAAELQQVLQQVLVTEYDAGAAIGWHRDKAVFGDVIGISLLSSCLSRLRRKVGPTWERASG